MGQTAGSPLFMKQNTNSYIHMHKDFGLCPLKFSTDLELLSLASKHNTTLQHMMQQMDATIPSTPYY